MHTTVIVIVLTTCRPLAIAAWAPGWLLAQAGTKTISSFSGNTLIPDIKANNGNHPNLKALLIFKVLFLPIAIMADNQEGLEFSNTLAFIHYMESIKQKYILTSGND